MNDMKQKLTRGVRNARSLTLAYPEMFFTRGLDGTMRNRATGNE